MSRVLINGQDVNMTDGFPEMNYDEWKALPRDLRPDFTVITDRDYTSEPLDNSVSVTADGVKTCKQLLEQLQGLIDYTKVTRNAKLIIANSGGDYTELYLRYNGLNHLYFFRANLNNQSIVVEEILVHSTASYRRNVNGSTYTDVSSSVPTSGITFTLYYNIVASGQGMETSAQDVTYGSSNVKAALDGLKAQMFGTVENLTVSAQTQSNFVLSGLSCQRCGDEAFFSCNVKVSSNPSSFVKVATVTLPVGTHAPLDIRQDFKWTDVASQYSLAVFATSSATNVVDVYMFWRGGSTSDNMITVQERIPIAFS